MPSGVGARANHRLILPPNDLPSLISYATRYIAKTNYRTHSAALCCALAVRERETPVYHSPSILLLLQDRLGLRKRRGKKMERLAAEVAQRPMREEDARRLHRTQAALLRAKSRENLARLNAVREAKWDRSMHRSCPSNLRGLKPITPEPWARDALVYAHRTGSFEQVVNANKFGDGTQEEEYNDESVLDSNNGYRSHVTATGLKRNASLGGQPLWDSSTRRYTVRARLPRLRS